MQYFIVVGKAFSNILLHSQNNTTVAWKQWDPCWAFPHGESLWDCGRCYLQQCAKVHFSSDSVI